MLGALLSVMGLAPSPAGAADAITCRARAEAAYHETTARVAIPISVRETDGMLQFVTKNDASATVTTAPAGWTYEGERTASTDTQTLLFRVAANDVGRNPAITFSAITKATIPVLAYDGTAATMQS